MVRRISEEILGYGVELGTEGRLLALQLGELIGGLGTDREQVIRDYVHLSRKGRSLPDVQASLAALDGSEPRTRRWSSRSTERRSHVPRQLSVGHTYRSRMLDSASRDRPSRTALARCSPTPSTAIRSSIPAASNFCKPPKWVTRRSTIAPGMRGTFESRR